ncbi:protein of unknown function [Methylobacterium sp. UNC378MF]|uniref:DUF4268 domain-containing protein n=1 Tax=Methylobacterium sp. UNC378MF TaxID=1502748 RepID=UPI0008847B80|nr:DUF4268 domain-containing protein [Methylobacterium sp. UNC378MF]SDA15685.1 protein of unknown function [Methylobacterium sp. UNC378MF]
MYKIDKEANRIIALEAPTFSELGFKERSNIQEWIANQPDVLGEELLIIQKEFSGFSDTNERLDLLALDKDGALVLIENKLDDAGRDVTWQALKYASYCSRLSRDDIRRIFQDYLMKISSSDSADDKICEFFEVENIDELALNKGVTQRIILVAAKFRKEVTSTVMWLMNFKIRLQCFRTQAYRFGDNLFLSVEQIIPTKDAEEFMVGLATKALDEVGDAEAEKGRHSLRREFWGRLIKKMNSLSPLYASVSPQRYSWISASSGVRGLGLNFVATETCGRVELYIDRGEKAMNELIYDDLLEAKSVIEADFGQSLEWQRLEDKRACRLRFEVAANVFDRESWPVLTEKLSDAMNRLDKALKGPLVKIKEKLKAGTFGHADASVE